MVLDEICKQIEESKEKGKELFKSIKQKTSEIDIKKQKISDLEHDVTRLEADLKKDVAEITTHKQELISLAENLKEALE